MSIIQLSYVHQYFPQPDRKGHVAERAQGDQQRKSVHFIVYFRNNRVSSKNILRELHWLPIPQRIDYKIAIMAFKILTSDQPAYLSCMYYYYYHTSECTHHTSECTYHTSECTYHTSECTHHTSECTYHTSECTHHTSECTHHTSECTHHTVIWELINQKFVTVRCPSSHQQSCGSFYW